MHAGYVRWPDCRLLHLCPKGPAMTPTQIALVQQSFGQVQPIARQAAALFYGRLFELDPSLRPLFRGDLARQGDMLMAMMARAVAGLRNVEQLAPVLAGLGARHVGYGVRDAHYATVGEALLWTLQQGLGEGFTAEVHGAWTAAYTLLSQAMLAGAREQASNQVLGCLAKA
jgi:hemoglobin-like flavoprotein